MRRRSGQIFLLVALIYPSVFAQSLQITARKQFLYPESLQTIGVTDSRIVSSGGGSNNVFPPRTLEESDNSCATAKTTLLDFEVPSADKEHLHEVPVWQLPDREAFFFLSGMTVDADGAPNAYNPDDTGLDALSNAGTPGRWNGIVTDKDGIPLIQRDEDPFPGYYISCTSLVDRRKNFTDPTGYVDASKIPYVALPQQVAEAGGAELGDFAVITNLRNGKSAFAIYADIGTLGEGSVALAEGLGIRSDARDGGQSGGVLYLVFPGSGNLAPRTINEIQTEGKKLLYEWGGVNKLFSCIQRDDPAAGTGDVRSSSGP